MSDIAMENMINATRTLTYFTDDNEMVTVDVIEVEASDLRPDDDPIGVIEANGGFWTIWNSHGSLLATFNYDEE